MGPCNPTLLKLRKAPAGVRIEAGERMDADRAVCRSSLKRTCAEPTMKKARKQPINATTPDAPRGRSREHSHEEMQMLMKAGMPGSVAESSGNFPHVRLRR